MRAGARMGGARGDPQVEGRMSALLALASLLLALGAILAERRREEKILRAWRGGAPRAERPRGRRAGPRGLRRPPKDGGVRPGAIPGPDLALLVTEVASRLRAGAPVEAAWRAAFGRLGPGAPFDGIDEDGSPAVLRELGRAPGLLEARRPDDLARVLRARSPRGRASARAARALRVACRLAARNGAPLAAVLDAVAAGLDEAEAAEEARRIASQGARTSTRILLALPFLAVLAGEAIGARPIDRFFGGGAGTLLGVIGLALLLAARLVSGRLLARAARAEEGLDPALACDLARAALEAGSSIPTVLESLGVASEDEGLAAIGRGLRLGLPWEAAWEGRTGELLARALEGAWRDGIDPEELLVRSAAQHRSRRIVEAKARAEALGVELAVPLAALLLPAFLLLGLGPVLLHLLESGVTGLR